MGAKLALGLRGGGVDFATTVAPAMGATIANAMFLSGFSAVQNARKTGSLGDLNPLPYPIMFGNCLGWLIYSLLTKGATTCPSQMRRWSLLPQCAHRKSLWCILGCCVVSVTHLNAQILTFV